MRTLNKSARNMVVRVFYNTIIKGSNVAMNNTGNVTQSIDSAKFELLQTKVIMNEGIPAEYKVAFLKLIEETK